jgi:hypothetical protein
MKARWRIAAIVLVLGASAAASEVTEAPSTDRSKRQGTGRYAEQHQCRVAGNSATLIYHLPGDRNYGQMLEENKVKKSDHLICFRSSAEAEMAGYRRSRSGKSK